MTNSGLGESIMSGERRLFRGATLFTVMSYNVLADELMQRHRADLYRSEYVTETRVGIKVASITIWSEID